MNEFYQSATYKIVQAMKATGNQPGVIEQWREMVEHWAGTHPGPDAAAILAWLPMWQVRPFYTPEELAPIFPALAVALRITPTLRPQKSPARLENELVFAGLPRVPIYRSYFIVERVHYWRKRLEQFPGEFLEIINGT